MKYSDIIENKFHWNLKHYKKLVLSSSSNNKNLEELIKKLNIVVDFYLKCIREYNYVMFPQDLVKDLKVRGTLLIHKYFPSLIFYIFLQKKKVLGYSNKYFILN